ncbi:hypothetical protein OG599_32800 [Streptomyces sp. NBC_01335]|uniref:hypothetical protein n=1 Tax=Streptomyces sp. NBC_01335 TaxID=2903828 RepID=UPI002E1664EE|nr:hypothetical protein OG599_32800 [Streptomyces sp. NBC_01335]
MFTPGAKVRGAAVAVTLAAALLGLGAGTADAAGWPPLQEGGHLYAGANGTGTVTTVDLDDFGTCHTLSEPALSVQIASGSASLELYPGADCTGVTPWRSGSLARTGLPWAMLSYRVVTP